MYGLWENCKSDIFENMAIHSWGYSVDTSGFVMEGLLMVWRGPFALNNIVRSWWPFVFYISFATVSL